MTKIDIGDRIPEKMGFSHREAAKVVETVFDIIKETLQHEDKVLVSRFGYFVIRKKRARRGRNPQTRGHIEITPRRILMFKPSIVRRVSLNRPRNQ